MKTKFICILYVCFFLSLFVSAQKSFILDFKNKRIDSACLRWSKPFTIKIVNINPNLYKIYINGKDTIATKPISSIPTISSSFGVELSTLMSSLKDVVTIVAAVSNNKGKSVIAGNPSNSQVKTVFNYILPKDEETKIIIPKDITINNLKTELAKIIIFLNQQIKYKNELSDILFNINKWDVQKFIYLNDTPQYNVNSNSLGKTIDSLTILHNKINTNRENLESKQNELLQLYVDNIKLFTENETLKANYLILLKAFDQANFMSDTIDSKINAGLIYIKNNFILNPQLSDTIESLPIQQLGDANIINVKIVPINSDAGLQEYNLNYKLQSKSPHYFSVGGGFYYANLKDDNYSINTEDSNNYKLFDEGNSAGEIGLTSLMHAGFKPENKNFGIHFTFGPAMSLTKVIKPRIVYGIGAGFGRNQMISVNLVGVAGYTNVLSKGYNTTTSYKSRPENVVVSKLTNSIGFTVGLIYNL
jgi:hypothetical protein